MKPDVPPDGRAGRKFGVITHNAKMCSFPGCENRSQARGLCTGHWNQMNKGWELRPLKPHHRIIDGMKFCPDCGETKPASAFQVKAGKIKQSQCGPCVGIRLRMKTYNLTREQVLEMMARGCDVCGDTPDDVKRIHIDHCHVGGQVRGVLCHACNTTIGLVGERPEVLRGLADYIERHR